MKLSRTKTCLSINTALFCEKNFFTSSQHKEKIQKKILCVTSVGFCFVFTKFNLERSVYMLHLIFLVYLGIFLRKIYVCRLDADDTFLFQRLRSNLIDWLREYLLSYSIKSLIFIFNLKITQH